jgi:hypothetical protein
VWIALLVGAALMGQDAAVPQTADQAASSQAVSVDDYHGDYEGPQSDRAQNYDSGILSALRAKESGRLEGSWTVADAGGKELLSLELRNTGSVGSRLEGAWRSLLATFGMNTSGFVSDVSLTGQDLEINYFAGKARSPTILHMHKDTDTQWHGTMLDPVGHKTAVVMSKIRPGA